MEFRWVSVVAPKHCFGIPKKTEKNPSKQPNWRTFMAINVLKIGQFLKIIFFCNDGKMGKCWILIFFQPIWSIWYSETFSTCFQTKCHFRNIEFVNNLVRYDFGSVISVSVIFFRFSVFRYFGKNTVSVEH